MDKTTITKLWHQLYGEGNKELGQLLDSLAKNKEFFQTPKCTDSLWYKNAVVYSLYVQFFNETFEGLEEKLFYLKNLGVNCIWLLPILESPMKDAGYDVSDYKAIRADLIRGGKSLQKNERLDVFRKFIDTAHQHGIRIIFDVVLNHCSNEHPFFQEAQTTKNSPYHDYFIWNEDENKYQDTRIIFDGICTSNWEYCKNLDLYYLHRFYPEQPDWNYQNPHVLLYIIEVFIFWKKFGIDGFRLDAIPFLWKKQGTNCESLPECHLIIKIIRAVVDYLEPGTLLLAEACQPTSETVAYFADDDECNGAYHFPLMPKIFRTLQTQDPQYIRQILEDTQKIPDKSQWFLFLRCHDELTLEMSDEQERSLLYQHYCKQEIWNFRKGSGIAARLYDLLEENSQHIKLAFSILLTLPGTPIIYYGDEIAQTNDEQFYKWMIEHTGYKDARNLCRNKIDWDNIHKSLSDQNSIPYAIYSYLQKIIAIRQKYNCFRTEKIEFLNFDDISKSILAYKRTSDDNQTCMVMHNLSDKSIFYQSSTPDLLEDRNVIELTPFQSCIFG